MIGMRVLIGCECSGRLRRAFRGRGHGAWSNDIKEAEDGSEFHLQCDVVEAITSWGPWDLIILHPDCSALSVSGNRWYGSGMPYNQKRQDAIAWTMDLWRTAIAEAPMVAMENPNSVIFPLLRASGAEIQYIQPWQFGHPEFKNTGLALRGLPKLKPTDELTPPAPGTQMYKEWQKVWQMAPSPERKANRSRTYLGVADGMADQWNSITERSE